MGRQHALGGVAAWLAATPVLDATLGLTGEQVGVGVLVAAGAAMLPDLDQHGSTIGRTYGPITNVLARLVAAVSGGHRNGTHSLLGVAALSGLAALVAVTGGTGRTLLLWLILGVGLRGVTGRPRSSIVRALVGAGLTAAVLAWTGTGPLLLLPLVAGTILGAASHVALDMLTPQRCPLLWPISRARYGIGLVTTGSPWTSPLVTVGLVGALCVETWLLLP